MTTVAYALGRPRPAASRGGDCRAYDINQGRDVFGPHRFSSPSHCRISNGMLRVTVGSSGAAPALTVQGWRGRVVVGDTYADTYADTWPGEMSTAEWLELGTITVDSPAVSAMLTAVRIVRISPEGLTLRLVTPAMRDAFVTLRRGEPMVRVQHGSTRPPFVDTDRRVRLTDTVAPVGTASLGRVEEVSPTHDGFPRFVASIDAVTPNAGTFSVTAASVVSARFGAGAGTYADGTRPLDLHRQLVDASTQRIVVA